MAIVRGRASIVLDRSLRTLGEGAAKKFSGGRSEAKYRAHLSLTVILAFTAVAGHAQDVTPPKAYTTTPGGINASDGTFVYSETDLALGSLILERYHRGLARQPNDGMFGKNFSSNFDIYVAKNVPATGSTNNLTVHIGNTASGSYQQSKSTPASIGPQNGDAEKANLSWNGTQFVYLDSSGTTYTFSATVTASGMPWAGQSRRVERIDFPDGRQQTFSYNAGGKPKLVEDSSGYAIIFDYNGSGDVSVACVFKRSETYVSTATTCAGAQRTTSYGYTFYSTAYFLTSAVDVLGKTTTYVNNNGVSCVQPPGFASCSKSQSGSIAYNTPTFSMTQVLADAGTWFVGGQDWEVLPRGDDGPMPSYDGHVEVYITDPNSQTIALTFTKSSPYTMTDQLGRVTSFKFDGGANFYIPSGATSYGSMLTEAIYPEGDKYQAQYSGPFRAVTRERRISKNGSSILDKTYGYGSCTVSPGTYQNCAKPLWVQDPIGNRVNYTYASHGGILTEMSPPPVANAARPLKVVTWTQRYAWVKNSGGTLVQASLPVWVKASETVCRTVAGASPSPTCDGAALQTVTTYEYGANGTGQSLLVKGVVVTADSTSHRTCYGYDLFDRKVSETQPNAGLGSCP